MNIAHTIHRFFFRRISTTGFGLLRIGFGCTVLAFFLMQLPDVAFLYSSEGMLPIEVGQKVFRGDFRYSILDYLESPLQVWLLYFALLGSTVLMTLGVWTRYATVLSVLLLWSFHEKNILLLGGGDTVLRNIGLLLMISPNISALSLDRAWEQWDYWKQTKRLLAPEHMPIWPMRLAFWQLAMIYLSSCWDKLTGSMWLAGSAPAVAMHHPHFQRLPGVVVDMLAPLSPFVSVYTLLFEFGWVLLFIPNRVLQKLTFGHIHYHTVKRAVLLCGILFHGGIFLFMDVGSFPFSMMVFYTALLVKEDFEAFRKRYNAHWEGAISILYDGHCILCRRSAFSLQMLDMLRRMHMVDFYETKERKRIAPKLKIADLDKALHIVLPDGTVHKGFYAFRELSRHIPLLWPIYPTLFVPGVPYIGEKVYAWVAERRKDCVGEDCEHS